MKKQLLILIAITLILFTPIQIHAEDSLTLDINAQDEFGSTLLIQSVIEENIDNVKWLLNAGANPNIADKSGVTPLHFSTKKGNLKIVKLLIEHGANVNTKDNYGFTPLMRAYSHNHKEIADFLIKNNANKEETQQKKENTNPKREKNKPFHVVPTMKPERYSKKIN